jgi:hypothetical protein
LACRSGTDTGTGDAVSGSSQSTWTEMLFFRWCRSDRLIIDNFLMERPSHLIALMLDDCIEILNPLVASLDLLVRLVRSRLSSDQLGVLLTSGSRNRPEKLLRLKVVLDSRVDQIINRDWSFEKVGESTIGPGRFIEVDPLKKIFYRPLLS